MVISDPLKLAFIHIPKCAGSTIRNGLKSVDSYPGRFDGNFDNPNGSRQNLHHLPLVDVRTYFPEFFEKIVRYESYAIVREPCTRFASAVLQTLRSFENLNVARHSEQLFLEKALEICTRLGDSMERRSYDLQFFQVQSTLVKIDGKQIVRNLYRFDELSRFGADLFDRHGVSLDLRVRHNQAFLKSNAVIQMSKDLFRPIDRRLLAAKQYRRARAKLRTVIGSSPTQLYRQLCANGIVREFVEKYYAEDVALYKTLRAPS